jgi:hypothetical protein
MPFENLPLGFETGSAPARTYYVGQGADVEIGFLKLFITTQNVDLSDLEQESPFEPVNRGSKDEPWVAVPLWDTCIITLVLRR